MTYEEFKQMMIKFFEEHPIKIEINDFHSEESSVDDDGNIKIDLSTQFE